MITCQVCNYRKGFDEALSDSEFNPEGEDFILLRESFIDGFRPKKVGIYACPNCGTLRMEEI